MRSVTTAEELAEIMPRLKPGEVVSYHVGSLICDAHKDMRITRLGDMARKLSCMLLPTVDNSVQHGMGYCTLVQRRVEPGVREYLAIRLRAQRSRG